MNKTLLMGIVAPLVVGCASMIAPPNPLSPSALAAVPAGEANIGPEMAEVRFSVSPLGIGRVDGEFAAFSASLTIEDAAAGKASISAQVDTNTVDMKNNQYQELVTSPAWFDIGTFPSAGFAGQLTGWNGDGVGTVTGEMTIKGVTRSEEMELRLTCDDLTECPGKEVGFEGRLTLSRSAYGMSSLRGVVSDDVTLIVRGWVELAGN